MYLPALFSTTNHKFLEMLHPSQSAPIVSAVSCPFPTTPAAHTLPSRKALMCCAEYQHSIIEKGTARRYGVTNRNMDALVYILILFQSHKSSDICFVLFFFFSNSKYLPGQVQSAGQYTNRIPTFGIMQNPHIHIRLFSVP